MADFYINFTTGDDATGDGSSGNPWKTHAKAISEVTEATTIHAAAGTYDEDGVGGTDSTQILSKPEITFSPTGSVTWQVGDNANGGLDIRNTNVTFLGDSSNSYTVEVPSAIPGTSNTTIKCGPASLSVDRGFTASYLTVTGASDDGLSITGDTWVWMVRLDNCLFVGNGEDGYSPHQNVVSYVRNCTFTANAAGAALGAGTTWYGENNAYYSNAAGTRKSNFSIYSQGSGYERGSRMYGTGMDTQIMLGSATFGDQSFLFDKIQVYGSSNYWIKMQGAITNRQTAKFRSCHFGGSIASAGIQDTTTSAATQGKVTINAESCVFDVDAAGVMLVRAEARSAAAVQRYRFDNCVFRNRSSTGYGVWTGLNVVADYIHINNCVIKAGTTGSVWAVNGPNYTTTSGHNVLNGQTVYSSCSAQAGDTTGDADINGYYFPDVQGNCDIGTGLETARAIGSYDLYGRPKLGNDDVRGAVYPQTNGNMMLPMQLSVGDSTSLVGLWGDDESNIPTTSFVHIASTRVIS